MPIEALILEGTPSPIQTCPKCAASPFRPFLRGMIQRGAIGMLWDLIRRKRNWRAYCALICWDCKEIVGYE